MHHVLIYGHSPDGTPNTYLEADLDFEQCWWEGTRLVFKAYDTAGQCVFIKIEAAILMENLLGFAADVEIKRPKEDDDGQDTP